MEDIHYASSVTTIFVFFLLYLWLLGPSGKNTSLVVNENKDGVSYPRGPEPWPLLGNLVHLSKISKHPDRELLKLAKQYGGLTMMWLGFHPVLIINKARDARNLLDNKGAIYSDRPSQNNFRQQAWPWRLLGTGLGPEFRWLRSINHRLLGPQQSLKLRGCQEYEATIMLRDLLETPGEFLAHSERLAISGMFSAVYGVRLARLDHPIMIEFYNVWREMLRYFQPGSLLIDYFPILQKLPRTLQPWIKRAAVLQRREFLLHRAFLTHLEAQVQADTAPNCFGAELLEIRQTEDIDDNKAVGILGMLIGAGADALSSVLQTFFKIMAMNPKAFRAAQEELDRVVGPTRLPTWEDEARLPYLRALIKEVHRYAPIGSLGVPHATTEDDFYNGHIPRGTIVFPNLIALSRDPDLYANPDEFMPERFLGDDLHASASANHPDYRKRDHCHYGFGRRVCQGIFVAEAALYITIARTIWAFDISPQPGAPRLDLSDKIAGLITKPNPYRVRIVPRSGAVEQVVRTAVARMETHFPGFDAVEVNKDGGA